MPRMPLDDECRCSPLRRLWVPVPCFATASAAVRSNDYLDPSRAGDRVQIISCVDRPLSLRRVMVSLLTRGGLETNRCMPTQLSSGPFLIGNAVTDTTLKEKTCYRNPVTS